MNTVANFRHICCLAVCFFMFAFTAFGKADQGNFYQITVYHYKSPLQKQVLDTYLQQAYVPALHRAGIKHVGVFNTLPQDTTDRRVYVFIPFTAWDKVAQLDTKLEADKQYAVDAKSYNDALYSEAPFTRKEVILLKAFSGMPAPAVPALTGDKDSRVYELRSYESATEKYHINKVDMFNAGDEIGLFNRLGFNAVFYARVLAGSRMPNLMYMTSFNNMQDRDAHWKAFGDDAAWRTLSAKPEYKNNVSRNEIVFLRPAPYSDF